MERGHDLTGFDPQIYLYTAIQLFLPQEKENLAKLQALVAHAGGWNISRNLNPAMDFDERVRVVQGCDREIDQSLKIG